MNNSLTQVPLDNLKLDYGNILLPVVPVMVVTNELHFSHSLQALLEFYNLSSLRQFHLVGEANSQEQSFSILVKQQPFLIIIDWDLFTKQDEGVETVEGLYKIAANSHSDSKLLVISTHEEDSSIFTAIQAGAWGYILKRNLSTQLHLAITAILRGQLYLCPEIAARFLHSFHLYQKGIASTDFRPSLNEMTQSNNAIPYKLTNREREVLQLLVEGYRNEEIANCLYVTVATVKAHLTTIFKKLGVNSRNRAIIRSLHLGIV